MALQLCRICGSKESLLNILEQGPAMLEKLSKCANIDVKFDDFLPKLICQQCDHMLDMSFQLRRQSETMQEKLQQEFAKREDAEVHYISDDEVSKSECVRREERSLGLDNEEEVTLASTVTNAEEFMPIDQDTFDTKTESTILASETEDINELEEALKSTKENDCYVNQTFRPVSAEDIESNESYDVDMTKSLVPTTVPDKIISEYMVDDEVVDIGDVNDELMQDCHNTNTNSQFVSALEYCSIDLASNAGSPTRDIDHEVFGVDSRSSASPYTCVTCNEVFIRKKDYHDHIEQHGASRYQCIQCLAFFPTRYRLVRHEATHTDIAPNDCPYCKRQYTAGYNLKRHIKACHSKKNKYHCDICQMSYARQDVLKRHVLQIHTNKKWHCKACGESFRSAYYLNVHKSTCGIDKPPPISNTTKSTQPPLPPLPPEYIVLVSDNRYKCIHCNALFKTLSIYRNHLLIHQDIRPFPCTTCPKAFRTRYALINHERIHSNERPFKCEICLKSFRQVTHLKHHRYQHMKDDLPFNCTKCQMGFVTKWKLREHLRKHFTEKAFKCAECPEGFFLKYDLKRHARLVHYRSVDIVDSDNEGNQNNQLDFTEGTTETDKTDDERNIENEMAEVEDVIDILDDDEDEENDADSSNSLSENFLVLNEAEPPSPGDVREASKESIGNLGETVIDFKHMDGQQDARASLSMPINMHSEDANEPQVHFINFDEDEESTPAFPSDNIANTDDIKKQTVVDFIDLDEGPSGLLSQPFNAQLNADNSTVAPNETADMDIINLDQDEEEEEGKELTPPPQVSNVVTVNEPQTVDFMQYTEDDTKPQFLASLLQKSENQGSCDKPKEPVLSSGEVIDYIHLDSSNSCKSPPRYFNNEYFNNIIEGEEQEEEYDTITEEKIQITEEKIETFTSFYNLEDMTRS